MRSIPLLNPLLLLLLLATLFTTLTTSHPGGGEIQKAGKQEPKLIPNERATWNCSHKYKVMYSHYKLSGRDWNKTEKEIKRAVANEGIITRWKFEMNEEEDSFVSSFNLPLGRADALGKSTSMLLGINKQLKNETSGKKNVGVSCPHCAKC
ncbi:hypothetical protein MBLNU13_g04642t1 [Cladosporium sp. NU13]